MNMPTAIVVLLVGSICSAVAATGVFLAARNVGVGITICGFCMLLLVMAITWDRS